MGDWYFISMNMFLCDVVNDILSKFPSHPKKLNGIIPSRFLTEACFMHDANDEVGQLPIGSLGQRNLTSGTTVIISTVATSTVVMASLTMRLEKKTTRAASEFIVLSIGSYLTGH